MGSLQRNFRKYHRVIGTIICLPLALTVVTGMLATLVDEWSLNIGLTNGILMRVHTGKFLHLESIYPLFNGLGSIVLLVTGLSMTSLFNRRNTRTGE